MSISAMGPTYAGGEEPLLHEASGYRLTFLPDVCNYELQRNGENPVFYWVPNMVRLARKQGPDDGDYLFNLLRFAGAQSAEGMVGVEEEREVAGGIVTFTITSGPPDEVLAELQAQIVARYADKDDYFWGIRRSRTPIFRPAIIRSNYTTISNISPLPNGGVPSAPDTGEGGGARRFALRGAPVSNIRPPRMVSQRSVRNASNLDPWFWQMFGQGEGSISPSGANAYSALVGAYPAAIMWDAFHGTASPIVVNQSLQLLAWSPVVELTIRGNWRKVFEHFSAAASGRYFWASADIQAEFNNMRTNGTITVDLKIDPTIPGGETVMKNIEERSNLVYEKFMDEARRIIFEPPQPEVEAAEASSGGGFFGAGFALKYRRDEVNLELNYHEKRQLAYLQPHVISSSLTGMFEEMAADPAAEGKYFRTVYLDDWPKKLARIVKPVVNWQDNAVAFVSAQVGYPSTNGDIQWEGRVFQSDAPEADRWTYEKAQKELEHVANAPGGWTPDKTFVKRRIHMNEAPSAVADPYRQIQIDQNTIDIDPGENGSLINDVTLEVRADTAGRIAIGPIDIAAVLADETQKVEAIFETTDERGNPVGREAVKFSWSADDQRENRYWTIFSGDPDLKPFYRYKVRVVVKGSIFEPGMEWEGPWIDTSGNGPITLSMPMRGESGVTVVRSRELPFKGRGEFEHAASEPPAPPAEAELPVAARGTNGGSHVPASYRGWMVAPASQPARHN